MYNVVTKARRKNLITHEEVIDQAPVGGAPDPQNIRHAIQIAEERFIVPLIGQVMYDDMREKKNTLVTELNKTALQDNVGAKTVLKVGDYVNAIEGIKDEWQVKLWNEHLWKITAEAVYYIANPTIWAQHTAAGILNMNPNTPLSDGKGGVSVYRKDLDYLQDNALMNRIDPLITGMKRWVSGQYGNFPLWPREDNGCCGRGEVEIKRKSAYVNIYNDNYYGRR